MYRLAVASFEFTGLHQTIVVVHHQVGLDLLECVEHNADGNQQ